MSKYIRKTRDEWEVQGYYDRASGWEMVTTEDTYREARERIREYRENDPGTPYKIKRVRVKIEQENNDAKTESNPLP